MKKTGRFCALVLVICMLAGCGSKSGSDSAAAPRMGDYSVEASLAFLDPDAEVLSVGGLSVSWREYHAYMLMAVAHILNETGETSVADWDAAYSGAVTQYSQAMSYGEYVKFYAWDTAGLYRTIDLQFAAQGLTLDADRVETKETFMSKNGLTEDAEFDDYLAENGLTEDLFNAIQEGNTKYGLLLEAQFGKNGQDCPDSEVAAYAESFGYVRVKQIFISGVTDTSREKAETILAALQAAAPEELETVFDEYVESDSEDDSGKSVYPDGYLYLPGSMNDAFEAAAEALGENQLGGVVESSSGYHIILRLPIDYDQVPYGASVPLRYLAAADRFDSIMAMWQASEETVYTETYDQIIPAEVFVN